MAQDDAQAVEWFRRAANQGIANAVGSLGAMYAQGRGVPRDPGKAVMLCREAIEEGYARARLTLATLYLEGAGLPRDDELALKWVILAAEENEDGAANLRDLIKQRHGWRTNEECALRLAEEWKSRQEPETKESEKPKHPELNAGSDALAEGNYKTAREILNPLAEAGDPEAQLLLSLAYANDHLLSILNPITGGLRAGKWLASAAEQAYAPAMMMFGGLKRDASPPQYEEAARWYLRAAELGEPQAQYSVAQLYATGNGVPQDLRQAAWWYRRAAEQGAALAQFRLGECYYEGQGVPQNYTEAAKWLSLSMASDRHLVVLDLSAQNATRAELLLAQIEKSLGKAQSEDARLSAEEGQRHSEQDNATMVGQR